MRALFKCTGSCNRICCVMIAYLQIANIRNIPTDHISMGGNAFTSVRPFVSTLSSEPTDRWP